MKPSHNCLTVNRILLMAYKVSGMHQSLYFNEKLLLKWLAMISQSVVCLWISSYIYHSFGIIPKVCMYKCTQSSFGTFSFSHFSMQSSKCFMGSEFPLYFTLSCDRSSSCLNLSLVARLIVSHSCKVLQCAFHHLTGMACNAISYSGTSWSSLMFFSTLFRKVSNDSMPWKVR